MGQQSDDLHGSAPDACPVALLIIDMINDLEFPEGPEFLDPTLDAARKIAVLKERAKALKIPVIYVNDNFGRWRSDFKEVIKQSFRDEARGQVLSKYIHLEKDDYFMIKPKHSAFYETTLDTLLKYLKVERLILTGISADVCVLFSANDAYMRDFGLYVPADCVAAGTTAHTQASLDYMERVLGADVTPSEQLDLQELTVQTAPAAT
ncbi:cysteine hydrolase family protein [Tellurirhabdus bombi]|uniref:cysteine hydrolase family protein n=1 Tax=Tellurirhabdus bombi TaxID=2907205 RepID=UPI001F39413E|nr:isochorismatase family cysteine hydrolase [Tellurirhabdus bombi]